MAVLIDPRLAPQLAARGWATFQSLFTEMASEEVRGHPSRTVCRFELGSWRGFLKRQHWIPWKDYLGSWWAGFGFVDRSRREWNTLLALRKHGLACPEPLAVGCKKGQSFLLVRELEGAVDLHTYLTSQATTPSARQNLARKLGRMLARFHDAGFTHPDLYAKHVFIRRADGRVAFIDFQRTQHRPWISWRSRWRDLAALHASLGEALVTATDRLRCLRAYLKEAGAAWRLRQGMVAIRRRTQRLLRRRKIKAMRQPETLGPGERQIAYVRVRWDAVTLLTETKGAAR